jgi:hypothetical protein
MGLTEITKPEDMARLKGKPIYSAIFLTDESKKALLDWVREEGYTLHSEIKAHHITLEFKPADVSKLPVGEPVSNIGILRFYSGNGINCVSVLWHDPKGLKVDSGNPHITISHRSDVPPKRSLELMRNDYDSHSGPRIGPMLEGIVGVFGNLKNA